MRILIDEHDRDVYFLPWSADAICFNFKAPDRFITPGREMEEIKRPSYVETLVIGCDLSDYSFISRMKNLKQLYIYTGMNLEKLDFFENLVYLQHICICCNAASIDPLLKLIEKKYALYKQMPESEDFKGRLMYGIDGLFLSSPSYKGDASIFLKSDICRSEIIVNGQRITFREIMKNPKYREILKNSKEEKTNV